MTYRTTAAQRELAFSGVIEIGAKGARARRVQEWLTFHGAGTSIDSDFGSGTRASVRMFQHRKGLPESGRVNRDTWEALVEPMQRAVDATVRAGSGLDSAAHAVAMAHLREHPIELGGDNRGPWVRLYTGGNDGSGWLWCASFVSFVVAQAAALTGTAMPIKGSVSCDTLAAQARERGRFVPGTALSNGSSAWSDLGRCSIFLVRRTPTDWTHTGLAFDGEADTFSTIEGNTNDDGSRNGYEVCRRMRSVPGKDFIVLA